MEIPFDTSTSEGDFASLVTGGVEVSVDGTYLVVLNADRTSGSTSQNGSVELLENGSVIAQAAMPASTARIFPSVSTVRRLVSGDTITARSTIAQSGGHAFGVGTQLFVVRIGPVRWT